jgi:hypothetical protein
MKERYEFRIQGYLGPLLRAAVGNLRYRTLPSQYLLQGRLSDDELEGLLTKLDRNSLELVCLSRHRTYPAAAKAADGDPPAEDDAGTV